MTKLTVTPRIKELIKPLDDETQQIIISRNWISHRDLIKLYKHNTPDDLFTTLQGSEIYIPPPSPPVEPTPEFQKQLESLRNKMQEYEYQNMISPSVIPSYDQDSDMSPAKLAKDMKHQLTTIVNILISVVSVAYAIWYWTGTSMRINNAYRVLLCLFFSILVLVAEVVVFNGYLLRIDEAKVNEKKKIEVKKIIETVTFNSKLKKD